MDMYRVQFFVEDKHLARVKRLLMGQVRDLRDEPVINTKANGKNGVAAKTPGSVYDLFMDYVTKHRWKVVMPAQIRTFCASVGRSEKSYSHVLTQLKMNGCLKKLPGNKGNVNVRYAVVGGSRGKKK